ncbi:MAG TPA: 1,4-dihydroxy-2-naphthoate octaprenyltransferase [Candidatus Omnitrophota bacterium]|nr:1,4-dihydroxy-2-naphthoate octaprenyltransferase [Candidatus Omnitrophota bacterium]
MPHFKIWVQLLRAPFFTASLIPMLVGASLALTCPHPVSWNLLPLILLCGILIHAGANVLNDYFDFKNEVDTTTSLGSSHIIPNQLIKPTAVLIYGMAFLTLAFILGLILVIIRGEIMFAIGITGIIAGYVYTGKPFALKYHGLGNPLIFIIMGPLMVIGAYYALTGTYRGSVLLTSIPIGFLVTAILTGNNIRDSAHDHTANITTLEIKLGFTQARVLYNGLIIGAYAAIAAMAATKIHSWWILLTFLSLPLAAKSMALLEKSSAQDLHTIASLDTQTARVHLVFGLLFIIALVIEATL